MDHLAWTDWGVIAAYLIGVVVLGALVGRGQRSTKDYFLGGRSIPWWGVGLSIVATETSALTFLGVPAMAYGGDLGFVQIVMGYVVARILLAVVLVPHYFRGEIYSPYELFAQGYGRGARRTAAGFFLISGTLAAGVRVYVTCIPLQLILGYQEQGILWAILVFVILSLIYTYIGGIRAVVWTDALQFFLFVAGGLYVLFSVPLWMDTGVANILNMASDQGKLAWFRSDISLDLPYNIWMGLIGATVMACSTHGADQLIVQRVLTCRDTREGRKALILSAVVILPLFLLFLGVGILLWAYYEQTSLPMALPETEAGMTQNQYVFPIFILTAVPPVFRGLLIVGILAAAMSSVSSALSALASVSTMDFERGASSAARSDAFRLRVSRWSTIFWGGMLAVVAYLSQQTTSILNLAFSLNGLTNGAMLGGLLLAVFWSGQRSWPLIVGMVISLLLMLAIHFIPQSAWEPVWMRLVGTEIGWPWYTLIGGTATVVITLTLQGLARGANAGEMKQ